MGSNVPQSVRKLLEVLERIKKAFPTKKDQKGLRQVQLEVVPPRKRWSLSMTKSLRNPERMQITAHYARSMGTCRIPIIQGTAQLSAKITRLEKSNKKLKHTKKRASVIVTVTATTPICPEIMGPVALGIVLKIVQNVTKQTNI